MLNRQKSTHLAHIRKLSQRKLALESLEHRALLADLAQVSFAATDLLGQPVTTLVQGREYYLNASVQDLRGTSATGVSSAYFDMTVNNNSLLTVISQSGAIGGVVFSPLYPNNRSGVNSIETSAKEINEVGATTTENYFDANVQLFQMRFRADATGTITFGSNPGELTASIFALQGLGPISSSDVDFNSLSLPIASAIQLANNSASVNEDASLAIDVLANDTGGSSRWTIQAITDISSGGTVTIGATGKSVTYTPAANFFGTETFKYFTVDGNGVFGQATVTMTVNPVDDAPVNIVPGLQTFTSANRSVSFGPLNLLATSDIDVGAGKVRVTVYVNSGIVRLGSTTGLTFRSGANNTRYMLFDATLANANNALLNLKYTANTTTTSDVLTLDVHDLGNTGSGGPLVDRDTVNLALTGTTSNRAPVNSVPGPQTYTSSARTVIFDSTRPISVNDPDVGTNKLRMSLFVNNGTLTLPTTVGITFVSGSTNATSFLQFEGTQTNINTALRNLRYLARVGSTSDMLTVDTNDLGNTGSGGARTDRDFVQLSQDGTSTRINQVPVNTVPGAQTFDSSTRTVTFGTSNRVSVNDSDVVGTNLNLRVTLFVNTGIISLPTTTGLTFLNGANNTRYLLFDGTQANINTALLNMQFFANANSDVFTIDTHDLGNTGSGGAKVDRDTIALNLAGTVPSGRSGGGGSGEPSSRNSTVIVSPEASTSSSGADATTTASSTATDAVLADSTPTTSPLLTTPAITAVKLADLLASNNLGRQKTQSSADALFAADA